MSGEKPFTIDEWTARVGPSPYTMTAWEEEIFAVGLPAGPDPGFMKAEDGLNLAYREWVPDDWNGQGAVAVYVPGSSSHSGGNMLIGQGVAARGVFIRIIDTRGHGLSVCRSASDCTDPGFTLRTYIDDGNYYPGRLGDCLDSNQVIRDLAAHIVELKTHWPQATIHLAGHSSGGGCISRFVEHMDISMVDSLALIGPYNNWQQPQNIPQTNNRYSYVDQDLMMNEAIPNNPHRYVLGFNLNASHQSDELSVARWTWNMVQAMAATNADDFWVKYTKPVMYVAAEKDELFDLEECRRQHGRAAVRGPFVIIEDTTHIGLRMSDKVCEALAKGFTKSDF